jgi:2-polyprenyl-6-methoxyphenol hydroxylase-like FAD-dependent oxidoreductase
MTLNGNANGNANQNANEAATLETDLLIVGAGPAGASLACFLASHGQTNTVFIHAQFHANSLQDVLGSSSPQPQGQQTLPELTSLTQLRLVSDDERQGHYLD